MPSRSIRNKGSIPNEGSVARDHLAAERTFLAWVRTGLGVVGLGVLTGRFVETDGILAELLGLALVALGASMALYGAVRFRQVSRGLQEGRYAMSFWGPVVVVAAAVAVTVGAVVLLVT